jgi:hypothetical protein
MLEVFDDARAREAFRDTQADRDALDGSSLAPLNVGVRAAVEIALSSVPALRDLRGRAARLPELDLTAYDGVERYALALGHAQSLIAPPAPTVEPTQPLVRELIKRRQLLVADIDLLASHGILAKREAPVPRETRELMLEMTALLSIFRDHHQAISGHTAIDQRELERVELLLKRLKQAALAREDHLRATASALGERHRAFALFVRAYDSARRAVSYLRWAEGDADRIAPSLYKGRGGRKRPGRK